MNKLLFSIKQREIAAVGKGRAMKCNKKIESFKLQKYTVETVPMLK